jgi:hypothetical protein
MTKKEEFTMYAIGAFVVVAVILAGIEVWING